VGGEAVKFIFADSFNTGLKVEVILTDRDFFVESCADTYNPDSIVNNAIGTILKKPLFISSAY